jgi:hypothetical protein
MARDLFVIRGHHLSGEYNTPHLAPWIGGGHTPLPEPSQSPDPKDMALTPTRL